jgi:branched-chain amino acid transport system substrate-binding protein
VSLCAIAACAATVVACSSAGSQGSAPANSGGTGASTAAANGSGKVIKLGLLTSLTGPVASSFGQTTADAAQAAVKLANASHTLPGVQLQLIVADDQSSPAGALSALKYLVQQQHVFAVLSASAYFYAAEPFAEQQHVPVLGAGFDPGWANPQYTNLFAIWGSASADYPDFKNLGTYFKQQGGTSLCAIGDQSPSSIGGVQELAASVKREGLATPYVNVSLQVSTTDFSAVALAIKSSGCDVVGGQLTGAQDVSLIEAINNVGVKMKASYFAGGYAQSLLQDPAVRAAVQGYGFGVQFEPSSLNTAATKAMQSALAKYANYSEPNPAVGTPWGWFPAQLAVEGFKVAGVNASQSQYIAKLRQVSSFDYGGLTCPVDFSKFGYVPSITNTGCTWIAVPKGEQFVSATGESPIMLTVVPGTKN